MKVNVIGLGYIGLPTALTMASSGVDITGTDKNQSLLETLQKGELTFQENGMRELFDAALRSGNMKFSNTCIQADVYIIAVPTPYNKEDKKLDPSYVAAAVQDVLKVCPQGSIIAVESTIAPGTMDKVVRPLVAEAGFVCGKDIHIAHVPERIIPGNMVYELRNNSRTFGVDEAWVGETLMKIYGSFCQGNMVVTDIKTAEMTKVVENTFRDINIAFANELSRLCHIAGMDVHEIIKIANMHPRVNILQPGPGVGGHCISVDPWFLVGDYPEVVNIIRQARRINDSQPDYVLSRVKELMGQYGIQNPADVGFYGLTYKENVDDVRESPTLQLLESMSEHLAGGIKVYDPMVEKDIVSGQYHDFDSFLENVKLVVVMVAHDEIKTAVKKLENKIVFDTRVCLPAAENVIYL